MVQFHVVDAEPPLQPGVKIVLLGVPGGERHQDRNALSIATRSEQVKNETDQQDGLTCARIPEDEQATGRYPAEDPGQVVALTGESGGAVGPGSLRWRLGPPGTLARQPEDGGPGLHEVGICWTPADRHRCRLIDPPALGLPFPELLYVLCEVIRSPFQGTVATEHGNEVRVVQDNVADGDVGLTPAAALDTDVNVARLAIAPGAHDWPK